MKFDEFMSKLKEIKEDYHKTQGKELETIKELEKFIILRRSRASGRKYLKSLKGLGF